MYNSSQIINSSTNISYNLAKSGKVNITVYDIVGREITTLVDSYQNEGSYQINWNAESTHSTGVYFVRIQSGQFCDVSKILYLK